MGRQGCYQQRVSFFPIEWELQLIHFDRFLFLTYPDAQQAENALRVLDGTSFGKAHTLYVNRFGDIERYANLPIGEGELPTGWREKQYLEKVCSTQSITADM